MRICPKCHEEYIDNIKICPECGQPLIDAGRELLAVIKSIPNPRKLITVERMTDAEEIEEKLQQYKIDFYIGRNKNAEDFFVDESQLGLARNCIHQFFLNDRGKALLSEEGELDPESYNIEDWELYNKEEDTSMKIFHGTVIGFVLFAVIILLFGE